MAKMAMPQTVIAVETKTPPGKDGVSRSCDSGAA